MATNLKKGQSILEANKLKDRNEFRTKLDWNNGNIKLGNNNFRGKISGNEI